MKSKSKDVKTVRVGLREKLRMYFLENPTDGLSINDAALKFGRSSETAARAISELIESGIVQGIRSVQKNERPLMVYELSPQYKGQ